MKLINCNKGDFIWIQVQKNEDIDFILQKYDTTLNNIVRNNPKIDLYEGEMIKILLSKQKYHVVKPMENLKIIAQKYNLEEDEIINVNNLSSKRLFVGQRLKIEK